VYLCRHLIYIYHKDTASLLYDKAPAWESRGFVLCFSAGYKKKVHLNFDTPPYVTTVYC